MHSGVYNRVGGPPRSLNYEGSNSKGYDLSQNDNQLARNKYNADKIERLGDQSVRSDTYDTTSDSKWK